MFKTHYVNGNNPQKSYYKQYLNKLMKIKSISKNYIMKKSFISTEIIKKKLGIL